MTLGSGGLRWALVLVLVVTGCMTPKVHGKWLAYDAIEGVFFSIEGVKKNEAVLHWQVESTGLEDRAGEAIVIVHQSDCAALAFDLRGQIRREDSWPRWASIELPYTEVLEPDKVSAVSLEPCQVQLRPHEWFGKSKPRFDMIYQGKVLGEFEMNPPRRNAWLLVYPFAVAADAILFVPVVAATAVLMALHGSGLDDFTWTPDGGVDWHRKRSAKKRARK